MERNETNELPPSIHNFYKNVELSVDVIHVNTIPFLVSINHDIHFAHVVTLLNLKTDTLESGVKSILKSYAIRSFHITTVHVDIQLQPLCDCQKLKPNINVVSKGKHVPSIERFIRVVKERCRCCHVMLPFKDVPRIMVAHLMKTVMLYINSFVWKKGALKLLSPLSIVEGIRLDYCKHFHVILVGISIHSTIPTMQCGHVPFVPLHLVLQKIFREECVALVFQREQFFVVPSMI